MRGKFLLCASPQSNTDHTFSTPQASKATTIHRDLAPNTPQSSSSTLRAMVGLLQLPVELLLEVALGVDVTGLEDLSLTCRQLRPIGQVALLRTAVLPLPNIWKLAFTLQKRPDIAKAFTHIQLGSCIREVCEKMVTEVEEQCLEATLDGSTWDACHDMLVQIYPAVRERPFEEKNSAATISFAALVLLVAVAPNLKALTLPTTAIDRVDYMCNLFANRGRNPDLAHHERQQQVRSLVQSRLESLDISLEIELSCCLESWSGPAGFGPLELIQGQCITLSGFRQLRNLVLPLIQITHEPRDGVVRGPVAYTRTALRAIDPTEVLPKTLESIAFDMYGGISMDEMEFLSKVFGVVPHLKQLELRFSRNLLSTAWDIASNPFSGKQIRDS